jgi:hypothetical protein
MMLAVRIRTYDRRFERGMSSLLFRRSRKLITAQSAVFVLIALWAAEPLAQLLVHVARHGGVLTGAYGQDPYDQLAYLAWIRDAGNHILASNLWSIAPTPHDYLHPMYLVSGLLWRLGASVQVAYLLWSPIGLLVLFLGFAAYVRHQFPDNPRAQAAVLVLALFYETPLLAVAHWTSLLSPGHELQLLFASDDAYSALNLWGFEHTAIAIGLMPVFLIACERLLTTREFRRGGWSAVAAIAGALVSWLRPWQGLMLLLIVGVLFVARPPRRRFLALAVPVAATVLPLLYGVVLARADPSWASFQAKTMRAGTAPWWALLGSFGPVGVLALVGLGAPRTDRDWMLLLWPLACAAVYFVIPEDPPHALSGITLPLAVLAVRGWPRLRVPRAIAVPAALAAIAAVTVPAAVYHVQTARQDFTDPTHAALLQLQVLPPDEAAALAFIAHSHRPGGVLAPQFMSMSVPGLTGHPTYNGHVMWQPSANGVLAAQFFDPRVSDPTGTVRREILVRSRATYFIAQCGAAAQLPSAIAPLASPVRRFGCVTVYRRRATAGGS